MKVEERLLKYVSYWTTSDESCSDIPSSEREFTLAKALKQELETLGLTNILLTDHCYVYAKLPATPGMENCKSIGFIAHMDTAPDFSGKDVKPQIIPDYDGGDILLKGSQDVLKVSDFPSLASLKGKTLITTDGTTLLGADDKAGVAEIMTAVEELIAEGNSGSDLRRTKKSAQVRICLILLSFRQIMHTRWTAITKAKWLTKILMPQVPSFILKV